MLSICFLHTGCKEGHENGGVGFRSHFPRVRFWQNPIMKKI